MNGNNTTPKSRSRLRRLADGVATALVMLIAALAAMLLTTAAIEVAISTF